MRVGDVCGAAGAVLLGSTLVLAQGTAHQHGMPTTKSQPMHMMIMGDSDYVSMMLMHHDQGIEMAKAEAEKGERQEVKDLATKILNGQEADKKELQELQASLKSGSGPDTGGMSGAGGMQGMSGMSGMSGGMHDMGGMSAMQKKHHEDMDKLKSASGAEADQLFLRVMSQHHQMAVDMSEQAKPKLKDARVREFSDKTIRSQTAEIAEMKKLSAANKTSGK